MTVKASYIRDLAALVSFGRGSASTDNHDTDYERFLAVELEVTRPFTTCLLRQKRNGILILR